MARCCHNRAGFRHRAFEVVCCLGLKMDSLFLEAQVDRCRSLAEKADPFTKRRLLDLAERYEDRLALPSRASRTLRLPTGLPRERMQPPPDTRT